MTGGHGFETFFCSLNICFPFVYLKVHSCNKSENFDAQNYQLKNTKINNQHKGAQGFKLGSPIMFTSMTMIEFFNILKIEYKIGVLEYYDD